MREPDTRPHRRALVGALVGVLVLSNAAWFAGSRIRSPDEAAARARSPEASAITAPVERRRLEATLITRGDVGPRAATAVRAPTSVEGDPVVTAIGAEVGDEVAEGAVVLEVNGRPVFVLAGAVPSYRTMRPGSSGPDVAQLQAALRRLGHVPESDGTYGAATQQAVAALYQAGGHEALPSADDEDAALAAARQQARAADAAASSAERELRRASAGPSQLELAEADAAVASARRAHDLAVEDRAASIQDADNEARVADARCRRLQADPAAEPDATDEACAERDRSASTATAARRTGDAAVADAADAVRLAELARTDLDRPPDLGAEQQALQEARQEQSAAATALAELERTSGPTVPQGEVVFVPAAPARLERLGPASPEGAGADGGEADPSAALATLSSGGLEVIASVPASELVAVQPGDRVALLEETTGEERSATVATIDSAPSSDDGGAGDHRVQLVPDESLPEEWSGRNVRVTLTSAASTGEVLVVPLAAVSSRADGRTRVQRLDADDEAHEVDVTVGLSAGGFVEVRPTGGRLREGDLVVVGR